MNRLVEPPKVDREKALQTATGRLFYGRYLFSVPYMHFHDEEFLRNTGTMVTGDYRRDAQQLQEPVATMQSPGDMAMYVEQGIVVKGLSAADAATITIDIEAYLNERKEIASSGFDVDKISMEWVERFELLRNALAGLASEHWAVNPRVVKHQFTFGSGLIGSGLTRSNTPPPQEQVDDALPVTKAPVHPASISIQESLLRRGMTPSK